MSAPAVLIMDDDREHVDRLVPHLRLLRAAVIKACTKEDAVQVLDHHDVELVLLELGLGSELDPDVAPTKRSASLPALDILEIIRSRRQYTPVVVLTHYGNPVYELMAIRAGADAFIRKPADLSLLTAYIRGKLDLAARFRVQAGWSADGGADGSERSVLIAGDLLIDTKQRLIRVGNAPYQDLSAKEMKLLTLLAENPGTVFSRCQLFQSAWEDTANGDCQAVDSVIKRLRKKIEPTSRHPRYLVSARGIGYYLAA